MFRQIPQTVQGDVCRHVRLQKFPAGSIMLSEEENEHRQKHSIFLGIITGRCREQLVIPDPTPEHMRNHEGDVLKQAIAVLQPTTNMKPKPPSNELSKVGWKRVRTSMLGSLVAGSVETLQATEMDITEECVVEDKLYISGDCVGGLAATQPGAGAKRAQNNGAYSVFRAETRVCA